MLVGYARVSTQDQNLSLQRDALDAAKCERIFEDKATGANADRPGLAAALSFMRPGDTLVIWKLSRLGRSTGQLIATVQELQAKGIELKSLNESIDTTTASGKLMFTIIAAFAQFERDNMIENTRAGLDAARARGKTGGRPPLLDEKRAALARELAQDVNRPIKEICDLLNISRSTFYNYTNSGRADRREKVMSEGEIMEEQREGKRLRELGLDPDGDPATNMAEVERMSAERAERKRQRDTATIRSF